jgi:ADP-ribosyl-[dinitrogen reductase] hydrolase
MWSKEYINNKYKMINSMLGAFVGDAAGATLEFCNRPITEEMALNSMKMPGGGILRVGPGQITDDGELTLALWSALNHNKNIPLIAIAKNYKKWYDSVPFDIGQTCSNAFEILDDDMYIDITDKDIDKIYDYKTSINELNYKSEANGALMRATAIPSWAIINNISDGLAVKCAIEDACLSHPNIVCQEVNAIYVFAIIHLLKGKHPTEVLQLTNDFVSSSIKSDKVKEWYFIESFDISMLNAKINCGHVRWGFVLAIYFLRHPEISYEDAIKITLMKGGDTDTNAAIVGGIVAAYHNIPDYMLNPVIEFDCTIEGYRHRMRPAEYSVKKSIGHLINKD